MTHTQPAHMWVSELIMELSLKVSRGQKCLLPVRYHLEIIRQQQTPNENVCFQIQSIYFTHMKVTDAFPSRTHPTYLSPSLPVLCDLFSPIFYLASRPLTL